MAANPIVTPNLIRDTEQTVSETTKLKTGSLFRRIEAVLEKAFGDDEETIANSLRGL
jgi:hypothetical protein